MRKLFLSLALLTLSVGLAQAECVFTYTATVKLEEQFELAMYVFDRVRPISHDFTNGKGTVTYSSDITTIGFSSFANCTALQSITLPACVTKIGAAAFLNCSSLRDVTVAWTEADKIPAIEKHTFSNDEVQGSTRITLHVPAGTKALYLTAEVWKTFGTIDDPDSLFTDAKVAAIEAIQSAAATAKAKIDAASEYTDADAIKAEYKNKVDAAVAEAKTAIVAASTVQEVDEQQSIHTSKIETIVTEAKAAIAPINALKDYREKVIGEIENARLHNLLPELDEEQKEFLNETIDDAVKAVKAATTTTQMDRAEAKIFFILSMYPAGKAEGIEKGKAEALGTMGDECTDCTAVEVKKGDKVVTLYAPESVDYIER